MSRRPRSAPARSAVVAVALWITAALAPAPPASAHAIVLESEPRADAILDRAPERVVLRFNSKIEKRLSRVTLAAGRGDAVPLAVADTSDREPDRLVVPLRPLVPGKYVVRYKILSADGHITEGSLRFTVGAAR